MIKKIWDRTLEMMPWHLACMALLMLGFLCFGSSPWSVLVGPPSYMLGVFLSNWAFVVSDERRYR